MRYRRSFNASPIFPPGPFDNNVSIVILWLWLIIAPYVFLPEPDVDVPGTVPPPEDLLAVDLRSESVAVTDGARKWLVPYGAKVGGGDVTLGVGEITLAFKDENWV